MTETLPGATGLRDDDTRGLVPGAHRGGRQPGPDQEEFLGLLRSGTALVEPVLREVVDRLHPSMATVCRYHLGWDGDDRVPSVVRAGKRVRAALALLSARSAGAPERFAPVAGGSVELVHQLSLLHDDIMDGEGERRGGQHGSRQDGGALRLRGGARRRAPVWFLAMWTLGTTAFFLRTRNRLRAPGAHRVPRPARSSSA